MTVSISVDAMGGDFGPKITVPASLNFLKSHPDASITLVGNESLIKKFLKKPIESFDRLSIIHTTQFVTMDESPQSALKNKKSSSMRLAINLVKEGAADAIVSAGNTGALMATGRFVLKCYLELIVQPSHHSCQIKKEHLVCLIWELMLIVQAII